MFNRSVHHIVERIVHSLELLHADMIETTVQTINSVTEIIMQQVRVLCGVDATCTPIDMILEGKIAWFQCPWIP